jgi:predicted TIM-barrel enzyme
MRGFVATPLARSFAVWRHDRDRARRRAQHASNSCHGGPSAEPEDAQHVIDHAWGVARLLGASSMERLPTEVAITENMRLFKRITRTAGVAG